MFLGERPRLLLYSVLFLAVACNSGGARQGGGDYQEPPVDGPREGELEDYDREGFSAPGRGESPTSLSFGTTAEENFGLGEDAFNDEDYLAAQRYYAYVRNKFPYSAHALLSELRIGDCQFKRGRYVEAIDTYNNFVRLHPTHDKVAYALFKIGASYYEQIPGDWFLLPPAEEKEQGAVRDAERALKDYLERFPSDESAKDGQRLLADVRRRLLAHERYVADFYKNLGKDRAYLGRLEIIRSRFADVGLSDELLLEIVQTYAKLGEMESAKTAVKELEERFPTSPRLAAARAVVGG